MKEEKEIPFSQQFGIQKDREPVREERGEKEKGLEENSEPFAKFDMEDPLAKYAS